MVDELIVFNFEAWHRYRHSWNLLDLICTVGCFVATAIHWAEIRQLGFIQNFTMAKLWYFDKLKYRKFCTIAPWAAGCWQAHLDWKYWGDANLCDNSQGFGSGWEYYFLFEEAVAWKNEKCAENMKHALPHFLLWRCLTWKASDDAQLSTKLSILPLEKRNKYVVENSFVSNWHSASNVGIIHGIFSQSLAPWGGFAMATTWFWRSSLSQGKGSIHSIIHSSVVRFVAPNGALRYRGFRWTPCIPAKIWGLSPIWRDFASML